MAEKKVVRLEADDRTWEKTVEALMVEYADVWERLSGYTQEEREKDARKRQYEKQMLEAKKAKRGKV